MRLALIQLKAYGIENYIENGKYTLDMIKKAAEKNPDFILLPECAYPCYVLNNNEVIDKAIEHGIYLIEEMKKLCLKYGFYIACGMALRNNGVIKNQAVIIGKNGDIVHTHTKSNMWHFDRTYYEPGNEYDVFDTEYGKIGAIVCADGRMPEISALMAKKGAEIILNLANLTSGGYNAKCLTNPQKEYMLSARCRENNVYMALCCKTGVEGEVLSNAGGSCVISPNGDVISSLKPDEEEILYCDIDISKRNECLPQKRPYLYNIISKNTEELPVAEFMECKFNVSDAVNYISASAFKTENMEDYIDKAQKHINLGRICKAKFMFLPETGFVCDENALINKISSLLNDGEIVLISSYNNENKIYASLVSKKGIEAIWNKTDDNTEGYFCAETKIGKIGVIFGDEILIPEITRVYTLNGCAAVFVYGQHKNEMSDKIIKTRAAENKIYMVRNINNDVLCAEMISPEGNVVFSTLRNKEQTSGGYINLFNAAFKDVVPGTNVIYGRKPESFKGLTE